MRRKVEREITVCDVCGEVCYDSCLGCGADHCYDHKTELGITYQYAVHLSGSGNGYYCLGCDARLRASGDDPLHSAYLKVKMLVDEVEAFHTDIHKRAEKANALVEALRKARKEKK